MTIFFSCHASERPSSFINASLILCEGIESSFQPDVDYERIWKSTYECRKEEWKASFLQDIPDGRPTQASSFKPIGYDSMHSSRIH